MANVTQTSLQVAPLGGATAAGLRVGFINSATKAAQNDTVTVPNAAVIEWAILTIDATGATEPYTIAANVITLTSATTGAVSGIILYR